MGFLFNLFEKARDYVVGKPVEKSILGIYVPNPHHNLEQRKRDYLGWKLRMAPGIHERFEYKHKTGEIIRGDIDYFNAVKNAKIANEKRYFSKESINLTEKFFEKQNPSSKIRGELESITIKDYWQRENEKAKIWEMEHNQRKEEKLKSELNYQKRLVFGNVSPWDRVYDEKRERNAGLVANLRSFQDEIDSGLRDLEYLTKDFGWKVGDISSLQL